jgi:glycosyltransferase involved in cell wall biosynthesis
MSEKKVLIIAYYWPPSGGSGVQRWLKFVKYLPQFGWKPYVFTPENPSVTIQDESLLKDVPAEAEIIKLPIWEPYEAFSKFSKFFSGSKNVTPQADFVNVKQSSLFSRLSVWVRGNLIIPDPRKFWVKPAVRFLENYLKQNHIETIITTGPPHSMHLIGLKLKAKNPSLRWIVDMRDPWSEWGFLETLSLSVFAWKKHQRLEKEILQKADEVLTVTPEWKKDFERLSGRNVTLLTNGFDEDDFRLFKPVPQAKFVIRHIGIVNERCNPRPFMEVIEKICLRDQEFQHNVQIDFVGQVEPAFVHYVQQRTVLNGVTQFVKPVSHKKIMEVYATSSALLLVLTGYKKPQAYLPGKIFEYLATGLPVIGIGPRGGDAAKLLRDIGTGEMVEEHADIELMLFTIFQRWKDGKMSGSPRDASLYSRRAITEQLSGIL